MTSISGEFIFGFGLQMNYPFKLGDIFDNVENTQKVAILIYLAIKSAINSSFTLM